MATGQAETIDYSTIHSAPETVPIARNGGAEPLVVKLRSYSLIILPIAGFLLGQLLQLALGTKNNRQFESLMVHLITVILLVFISASVFSSESESLKTAADRVFCIGVSYLFVLGVVLGIISVLY